MMMRAGLAALALVALVAMPAGAKPARHHHAAHKTVAPREAAAAPIAPWPDIASDAPYDPAFHFTRLANGLRVIIVPNATPPGAVAVRMQVLAGSLDERDDERGLAHFVEHMAFEGSAHVPTGAMVPLLEREGLAFGADTNAFTGHETTTYVLDLPRNDASLLDTALMLMRETASELSFTPEAVAREKGVVLAEKRDRNSWQYRASLERQNFITPGAYFTTRMPIGEESVVASATPAALRGFWARNYAPERTVVMVVGDIKAATALAAVRAHFEDWHAQPEAATAPPQPSPGPTAASDAPRDDVYIDPASSGELFISRTGAWQREPDTLAQRQRWLLRALGYRIINRRLQHLAHGARPPFRDAAFATSDIFKAGRATNLVIDPLSGNSEAALKAAAQVWRQAMEQGFTPAEVDEQLANLREALEHAAAGADTRGNGALVQAGLALIHDARIPSTPREQLDEFNRTAPLATPQAVLAAVTYEALPLTAPLIRFQGHAAPEGGSAGLRGIWDAAMRAPLPAPDTASTTAGFAYSDFGPAGQVVADAREKLLDIRQLRFANGVRLNLRHTDLAHDQVLVRLELDGGQMLNTRDNPLATAMASSITAGGLGKHSQDDLQTLFAGHRVTASLTTAGDSFVFTAQTTPADLGLELQWLAAQITDPGYRPEGEQQYHLATNNYFLGANASPAAALGKALGGILSDNDPRFTTQPPSAYNALSFARLKRDLADRLAHGAIEIGIVGDFDEAQAIALAGKTLGALPAREPDFRPYTAERQRPFTTDHSPRTVTHTGPADQAMITVVWPTRDDNDATEKQQLNLLERIERIALTEGLRERLGKAYSPSARSEPSPVWTGYGTFGVAASVNVADLAATRAAIHDSIAALRDHPVSDDMLLRARAPLTEAFANALKTNNGWLELVTRAQSHPERIARRVEAPVRLAAVTAQQIEAEARRYLTDDRAAEVVALPQPPAKPQ